MTYRLSVLIPAREERIYDIDLLAETVANVLANTSDQTEIIAVFDGYDAPRLSSPRLTYIHHSKSIGQRAATNEAARVATGEWVMKLDAHCALSPDFDTKLLDGAEPDWTVVPAQYNLLAFVWKCRKCGWLKDQSGFKAGKDRPDRCDKCNSKYLKQVKQWFPRDGRDGSDVDRQSGQRNTRLTSWRFDTALQYSQWGEWGNRQEGKFQDTMSLLGACWAVRRDRYFELDMSEESYGSWGQQGFEVACKSWTSGGAVKCNTDTWFAHFFRVGGLKFPYPGGGMKERAMARCRKVWLENAWPKQVRPLSWLIEHFAPVPDWRDDHPVWQQVKAAGESWRATMAPTEGINPSEERGGGLSGQQALTTRGKCALYYSCLSHDPTLELAARNNLKQSTNGHELGVVTLNERIDFGDWQVVVQREKSGTTMHYQILEGLRRSQADYVFLCESDVFYHPSHFDFTPPRDDTFYYNTNVWRVRYGDGHAVRTDNLQQVSGICASRALLLEHYRKRIELIEANGGQFNVKQMAYEPGTRGDKWGSKVANWESEFPNIDITGHGQTLTTPHFSVESFRNPKYARGWQETDEQIAGWPKLAGRVQEFLEQLANG